MALDFKDLNNPVDNRRIREVIMVGGDTITIYEPSYEDFQALLDFQEQKLLESESTDEINITGTEMIKEFFPRLTDITGLENLSDEEIEKVVEEPSVALLQVEQTIRQIVSEVFKTMILKAKTEVLEADFVAENARVGNQVFDAAFSKAAREFGAEELLNRIDREDAELVEAIEKSYGRQDETHQELLREMSEKPHDKIGILSTNKKTEDEVLTELEEANPHLKAKNLYEQYRKDFE